MARTLLPMVTALLYTLTRIYSMEYTRVVEIVFEIVAEPNRARDKGETK